ncbi:hypothetical protein V411_07815 [Escherichia coli LAU-EC6]|nr:hypothetical protein B185_015396 [Escherichia coli J96]ETE16774.1 hypothetical protein V411_07815 [Escherichia coli LAU-EC6]
MALKKSLKNSRYIIVLQLNMAAAYTILIIYELLPPDYTMRFTTGDKYV